MFDIKAFIFDSLLNKMLTLHKYKTEKNADSVEFCPHVPHQNVFVCANYELNQNEQDNPIAKRTGRILLFSITSSEGLQLLQTIECAGVLDTKWCHNKIGGRSILGVANAEKSIEIYELTDDVQLRFLTKVTIKSNDVELLILSLDWSTGKYESNNPEIVCSDSKGYVHRIILENNELSYVNGYKSHDFECWIVAYDYFDTNIFYSGGDDAKFLMHDKRLRNDCPVFKNSKTHEAGVTSVHSNSKHEHLLATGSYDSFLRLWDTRNIKDSVTKLQMPGTLWRLKWDPFEKDYLLAACMLGGAHVLSINKDNFEAKITCSYNEHKSLVYGIDWCWLPKENIREFTTSNYLIGSCSFYDNLLCLSTFNIL